MTPDIFFLPFGEKEILYAPLSRFIAEVNGGAKNAVAKRLAGQTMDESQQGVVDMLEKRGVFSEDIQTPGIDEAFCPTRVTLFPTDNCNLRCKYCYASAADSGHKMPPNVAHAAIDFVAENAKNKGMKDFSVGFHGNGEPFAAFDVVQDCCEYIGKTAERLGMKSFISTATNGVLDEEKLDYLIAWITDANVSSDILPDIQNRNRPLAGGGASFDKVDHTLRRLNAAGVQFGIRATITEQTVHRLQEMAAFVKENYPKCNLLHFEPVFEVGRALENSEFAPDPQTFVREYVKARNELRDTDTRLVFSGARQDTLCCCFCSVCRNAFSVTAEGNVTSCYEVCTYEDSRAERYIYGKFDQAADKFIFDQDKLDALAALQVSNIPFCKDCFAKWHCGGDCAAKALGLKAPDEHTGSSRCVITRALIYRQILEKMGKDISDIEPIFI